MSAPYCGIKDVPNGKERGSMKECVECGKVSYYGKVAVDPRTLQLLDIKKKKSGFTTKMRGKMAALKVKSKKLKERYDELQSKDDKKSKARAKVIKENYTNSVNEYNDYVKELKKVENDQYFLMTEAKKAKEKEDLRIAKEKEAKEKARIKIEKAKAKAKADEAKEKAKEKAKLLK